MESGVLRWFLWRFCTVSLPCTRMDLYILDCIWNKEPCWCLNLLSFHYFHILICVCFHDHDILFWLHPVATYHISITNDGYPSDGSPVTHFYLMVILVSWLLGHLFILWHGFVPAPILCPVMTSYWFSPSLFLPWLFWFILLVVLL